MSMSRRRFLGTTAATVLTAGSAARSPVWGANDRIGVCVIGLRGQGSSHIRDLLQESDAEVVALCDVDSQVLEQGIELVRKTRGKAPKAYRDVREVMTDPGIDAVTTATPNHWHALITVWGCRAGKDVYVCLLYTSPSPRDLSTSRMPSSA